MTFREFLKATLAEHTKSARETFEREMAKYDAAMVFLDGCPEEDLAAAVTRFPDNVRYTASLLTFGDQNNKGFFTPEEDLEKIPTTGGLMTEDPAPIPTEEVSPTITLPDEDDQGVKTKGKKEQA